MGEGCWEFGNAWKEERGVVGCRGRLWGRPEVMGCWWLGLGMLGSRLCGELGAARVSSKEATKERLHLAAWSGQTEVVNYLCKHKGDVGAAAMDDTAAIHFASQKGHLEVVRALLSAGVSVKASTRKGLTPLHYAVQGSHLELVKYLVRKGANLSAKTKSGQIPLDLANGEEVRSYLVECEESLKKGDKSKIDNPEPKKQSDAKEEESDMKEKRKGEEIAEESWSESKKARVSLQHLIAEDDAQDEEEQ